MINKIQITFTIYDLEILTGIKAHTIRIWEKRYQLLNPDRLNRNVRVYSVYDLQKILNVSFLQKNGFKISNIAKLSPEELNKQINEIHGKGLDDTYSLNKFLLSMFQLDEAMFEEAFQEALSSMSFRDVFIKFFYPLLRYIGLLWQTDGVTPGQEHFVSNLIFQKTAQQIANLKVNTSSMDKVSILFLPEGEIHEIGLYFLSYLLKERGDRIIYLGRDVPYDDLYKINGTYEEINWVTSLTIDRHEDEKKLLLEHAEKLLEGTNGNFFIISSFFDLQIDNEKIKICKHLKNFL